MHTEESNDTGGRPNCNFRSLGKQCLSKMENGWSYKWFRLNSFLCESHYLFGKIVKGKQEMKEVEMEWKVWLRAVSGLL